MTRADLADKILKAVGGTMPFDGRERMGNFLSGKADFITVRYEWVKDRRFFQWIMNNKDVEFHDGAESVQVWVKK
jgi:hypothetical protein